MERREVSISRRSDLKRRPQLLLLAKRDKKRVVQRVPGLRASLKHRQRRERKRRK